MDARDSLHTFAITSAQPTSINMLHASLMRIAVFSDPDTVGPTQNTRHAGVPDLLIPLHAGDDKLMDAREIVHCLCSRIARGCYHFEQGFGKVRGDRWMSQRLAKTYGMICRGDGSGNHDSQGFLFKSDSSVDQKLRPCFIGKPGCALFEVGVHSEGSTISTSKCTAHEPDSGFEMA